MWWLIFLNIWKFFLNFLIKFPYFSRINNPKSPNKNSKLPIFPKDPMILCPPSIVRSLSSANPIFTMFPTSSRFLSSEDVPLFTEHICFKTILFYFLWLGAIGLCWQLISMTSLEITGFLIGDLLPRLVTSHNSCSVARRKDVVSFLPQCSNKKVEEQQLCISHLLLSFSCSFSSHTPPLSWTMLTPAKGPLTVRWPFTRWQPHI